MRCEDVQAPPPAIALQGIGGVRHQLQFAQHKLGDDQHPVNKAGFANVGDAAVDDDAGVEHFVILARRLFRGKKSAERAQIEQVTFIGAQHQSHVGHQQQQGYLKK